MSEALFVPDAFSYRNKTAVKPNRLCTSSRPSHALKKKHLHVAPDNKLNSLCYVTLFLTHTQFTVDEGQRS